MWPPLVPQPSDSGGAPLYMRKILRWSLGLILLPAILGAADISAVLKREVAKCASAWQRSDFETIVSYQPPRVIARSGGRAAVLRELKDQFAQARALGVERLEAKPGQTASPRQIGPWLVSLVPITAVLHSAHIDLTQRTHVLAVSADAGKRWSFMLLYQVTQAELREWFPELGGKIVIPADPVPQMEFVY